MAQAPGRGHYKERRTPLRREESVAMPCRAETPNQAPPPGGSESAAPWGAPRQDAHHPSAKDAHRPSAKGARGDYPFTLDASEGLGDKGFLRAKALC